MKRADITNAHKSLRDKGYKYTLAVGIMQDQRVTNISVHSCKDKREARRIAKHLGATPYNF